MDRLPHVLVIGAGSAGRRHARNLRELSCIVSACDPRADRLQEIEREGPLATACTVLETALESAQYDGFVVASPPHCHVDQILLILSRQQKWVMCEKPLGIDGADVNRLGPSAQRVLLAYTYRWWPPIQSFRRRLLAGEIGAPRSLRFVMSAHLQDWHPWERYQEFFMAQQALGGGALLDESHFIDLMLWFLGTPTHVYAQVDKITDLEIDSDDVVDILATYADRVRVNIHLDLIGRPHERKITAVGERGTLVYAYEENAVKVSRSAEGEWEVESFACERNEMFRAAAVEFKALMTGVADKPSCGVTEGAKALAIVDACRASARTRRAVVVEP